LERELWEGGSLEENAGRLAKSYGFTPVTEWKSVSAAPLDRDLEVCVVDKQGEHLLGCTCRQTGWGWTKALTGSWIHIDPTHWREVRADGSRHQALRPIGASRNAAAVRWKLANRIVIAWILTIPAAAAMGAAAVALVGGFI
jgi:hypothetical protein